jgi:glutamate--cysteine ligase
MSGPQSASAAPIESKAQLVDYLAAGSKPPEDWRIGTEHEKFAFRLSDLRPLPYDGPDGIRAVLEGLAGCRWSRAARSSCRARRCAASMRPAPRWPITWPW